MAATRQKGRQELLGEALCKAAAEDDGEAALAALEAGASLEANTNAGSDGFCRHTPRTPVMWCLATRSGKALEAILGWADGQMRIGKVSRPRGSGAAADEMRLAALAGRADLCARMAELGWGEPCAKLGFEILGVIGRSGGRRVGGKDGAWPQVEGMTNAQAMAPVMEWICSGIEQVDARERGQTMLMKAGGARVAKALLAAGADPNAVDSAGMTALAHAVKAGQFEWARELAIGGADLFRCARSERGAGPFMDVRQWASMWSRPDEADRVVKALRGAIASEMAPADPQPGKPGKGSRARL